MKLKLYIAELEKLVASNPEILEYEVVYAKDDEGNGYNIVYNTPELGMYDEEEREFTFCSEDAIGEYIPNAVIIN